MEQCKNVLYILLYNAEINIYVDCKIIQAKVLLMSEEMLYYKYYYAHLYSALPPKSLS